MNIRIKKLEEPFTEFEKLVNSTSAKIGDIVSLSNGYYINLFIIGLSDNNEIIMTNLNTGDIVITNLDITDAIKELIETYQANEFVIIPNNNVSLSIDLNKKSVDMIHTYKEININDLEHELMNLKEKFKNVKKENEELKEIIISKDKVVNQYQNYFNMITGK